MSRPSAEQWRTAEYRRHLLLELKDALRQLTPFAHKRPVEELTEENPLVSATLSLLEQCLLHGARVRDFHGIVPLWGLLERLEVQTPPCEALRSAVGAVASCASLRTPLAKARAFVRQAMNARQLDECLVFLAQHTALLLKFYERESLLVVKEDCEILIAIVRSAKVLSFSLAVDDQHLNTTPPYIARFLQALFVSPSHTPTHTASTFSSPTRTSHTNTISNAANPAGSSTLFDSFFKSIDRLAHGMDNILSVSSSPAVPLSPSPTSAETLSRPRAFSSSSMGSEKRSNTYNANNNNSNTGSVSGTPRNVKHTTKTSFFASSLRELVLDESRCAHAKLSPALGVPTQALRLIAFVANNAATPSLFRERAPISAVEELKRAIEMERGFPAEVDVSVCAYVLIQWLLALPEPLFGNTHYEAFVAAAEIESEKERARNLRILLQDTPWYARPLLLQIIALMQSCLRPENTATNGLNGIALSLLFTPVLLRPRPLSHTQRESEEERERAQLVAAAAASGIVSFSLAHCEEVFGELQRERDEREQALQKKCARVRALLDQLQSPFSLIAALSPALRRSSTLSQTSTQDEEEGSQESLFAEEIARETTREGETAELLRRLHALLEPAHTALSVSLSPNMHARSHTHSERVQAVSLLLSEDEEDRERAFHNVASKKHSHTGAHTGAHTLSPSLEEIIRSDRWAVCGVISPTTPQDAVETALASAFSGGDALVAMQCLAGFLEKYGARGTQLVVEFAQNRARFVTLSVIARKLVVHAAEVLRLLSSPSLSGPASVNAHSDVAVIQSLARQSWLWSLLGEERCFQEWFDVGLVCVDETWRSLTERESELATNDTTALALIRTHAVLTDIAASKPSSVAHVWERWAELRLAEEERDFRRRRPAHHISAHTPSHNSAETHIVLESSSEKHAHAGSGTQPEGESVSDAERIVIAPISGRDIHAMCDVSTARSRSATLDTLSHTTERETTHHTLTHAPSIHETVAHAHETNLAVTRARARTQSHEYTEAHSHPTYTIRESSCECVEEMSEALNAQLTREKDAQDLQEVIYKQLSGIRSAVRGGSRILSEKHIEQLEAALPAAHQCYDWRLVYRLSMHGASLSSLLHQAQGHTHTLLVVQDEKGAIFGALLTEPLKISERDKYYGNGTIGVWSFASGPLKYYPWSFKNNYFLSTTRESIALGGGGHFALFLDSDLYNGSSGQCDTFNSPCLASSESFQCVACELFALQSPQSS